MFRRYPKRNDEMPSGTSPYYSYVFTISNSMGGPSILAIPFCLKECGLILGLLLLLVSAYLTRISCNLLLKTAKQARRTSYEYLALHSFGRIGKLAVETSIIGLLMGTCIAFYVIIGDLGPAIVSRWFGFENTWSLRTVMLVLTAVFVVLPLGLLRKVEQLSSISALSFSFYTVLIAQIILISFPTLLSFSWVSHARYWRTEGLFQCLSIFSLAFTCHTQVFVVYESLPDRTERKMNDVVKGAVNMVAFCYIMVGFFGYVAFCEQGIKGDVLMNFKTSFVNDLLKMGFVVSVALSFPMMIFPCRASINTLISGSQGPSLENPTGGGEHIPQGKHRAITCVIVFFTLLVGIVIPNVETVLGLTGSTTGTMIGYVFPAVMFLKCLPKGPGVKSAQMVLFIGIIIMFASTYSTLQSRADDTAAIKPIGDINILDVDGGKLNLEENKQALDEDQIREQNLEVPGNEAEIVADKRQEPPIPHAPADSDEIQPGKDIKHVDEIIKDIGEEVERGKDLLEEEREVVKEGEQIQGGQDDRGPQGVDLIEENRDEVKRDTDEDDDEAHRRLEEKVEMKVKEQDMKHEEQQKMIEELKEKQNKQEKIIEQQQEVIEVLKKQHDVESKELAPGEVVDADGGHQAVAGDGAGGHHVDPVDGEDGGLPVVPVNVGGVGGDSHQAKLVVQDSLQQQQQEQQQDLGLGNPAAIQHQAVHHDAEAAAVPADGNLGQPQVVEVIKQEGVDSNNLAARKDVADSQQQLVHEIKLPPAELANLAGGDANINVVAQQPQPRDILGVEGIKHNEKDDTVVHEERDTNKKVIQEVEKKESDNEVHHEQKEADAGAGSSRKSNNHHQKRHQSEEKLDRERRDMDPEDPHQNKDLDVGFKEPDNQVVKSQDVEKNNEDQEKLLYEDHLANLDKLKEENDDNFNHYDNKPADEGLRNVEKADRKNEDENAVRIVEADIDHGKKEHLRKEEVRR